MADWTTPPTFTSGDFLSASDMNTYVRDNTTYLKGITSQPAAGPFYRAATVTGGSSTELVDFYSSGTLVTPSYDYVMAIQVSGMLSGNSAPNTVIFIATDAIDGVPFSQQVGLNYSGFTIVQLNETDDSQSFSHNGARSFNAGEAAAFRLQYNVTNANVNLDCGVLAWISPQV